MLRRRVAVVGLVCAACACDGEVLLAPGDTIDIVPSRTSVSIGDTITLTVSSGGRSIPDSVVRWVSLDNRVLRILPEGRAVGVAPGTVGITASVGTVTGQVEIIVEAAWSHLAVGSDWACARANDLAVWCWGNPSTAGFGTTPQPLVRAAPTRAPALDTLGPIVAGQWAGCALPAGRAVCWGTYPLDLYQPTPRAPGLHFAHLALLNSTVCGSTSSYEVWCWEGRSDPVRVHPSLPLTVLSGGATYACGAAATGTYCWGSTNGHGQLGPGADTTAPRLVQGAPAGVTQVATGAFHVCVLAGASVTCWGNNWSGALGRDAPPDIDPTPAPVAGAPPLVAITSHLTASHTCGLDAGGRAWCWGSNTHGQVGDGTRTNAFHPVPVATELRFIRLGAGATHTCGVTAGDAIWCWGDNTVGQLGRSTGALALTPVPVEGPVP